MKPEKILTKEFLLEHYINQHKSTLQIQEENGIKSHNSVIQALRKYNLPIRSPQSKTPKGLEEANNKLWKGCGKISGSVWYRIKRCSMLKDREFSITIEYVWELFQKQDGKCALSGIPLVLPKSNTKTGRLLQTASLDRIDSSKGYILGNVQWVHKRLQTMKMHYSDNEFIEWCKVVADYQRKQENDSDYVLPK